MDMDPYVRCWFLTRSAFAERLPPDIDNLVAAGAMPGPIYGKRDDDDWWSALSTPLAERGGPAELHYAPSALWWARRAILTMKEQGVDAAAAAASNRQRFRAGFVAALEQHPFGPYGFPACFPDGRFDRSAALCIADAEWQSWLDGGYAVCLRRFSADGCVRKEALRYRALAHFDGAASGQMSPFELFELVEELEALLLPFAPPERPTGTPGMVIDRALESLSVGEERPYG